MVQGTRPKQQASHKTLNLILLPFVISIYVMVYPLLDYPLVTSSSLRVFDILRETVRIIISLLHQLYVSEFAKRDHLGLYIKCHCRCKHAGTGHISGKRGLLHHQYLWHISYLPAKFETHSPFLLLKQGLNTSTAAVIFLVYRL